MKPRLAAIVPMRHTSERVPGKNYRPLGGRPLFHHIIETLRACPEIDEIVIDTDSDTIRTDAAASFPDVQVVERPAHLRAGTVPMNDVLLHDMGRVEADLYLQTHSTNPLLRAATISDAIGRFLAARPENDSLFGVTRLQTRIWTADGKPLNHDPAVLLRTQDLEPLFEENSCMYLFTRELLEEGGTRIGARPLMHEIPRDEAWDIDEEIDFEVASALFAARSVHE
jgi:CMP-N-acetylneuraminic acid synthetase